MDSNVTFSISQSMKVSVIVPNYNHERFLQQRLESIFEQSYEDFEVILLDDASTDNSFKIIEKFKQHPKVSHCHINKTNSGYVFNQWETGLSLAKGELVWIAESDDFSSPDFLREIVAMFLSNPDLVLAYCDSRIVDEYNVDLLQAINQTTAPLPVKVGASIARDGKDFLCEKLIWKNVIPNASAVLFKKDWFPRLTDERKMRHTGDWLIWGKILSKGQVGFLNKKLNFFRKTESSTRVHNSLSIKRNRLKEEILVLNALVSFCNPSVFKLRSRQILEKWVNIHPWYSMWRATEIRGKLDISWTDLIKEIICKYTGKKKVPENEK